MHKIDAPDATGANEFRDGDAALGLLATVVWSKWLNTVQRELVAVVESEGIALDDADDVQMLEAIAAKVAAVIPVGTIMLFGQNAAPTGWTRILNWAADNAMICYAASGDAGSGGAANPQSAHTHAGAAHRHNVYDYYGGTQHAEYYNSSGVATELPVLGGTTNRHLVTSVDAAANAVPTMYTSSYTGTTGANSAPYYREVIACSKN